MPVKNKNCTGEEESQKSHGSVESCVSTGRLKMMVGGGNCPLVGQKKIMIHGELVIGYKSQSVRVLWG